MPTDINAAATGNLIGLALFENIALTTDERGQLIAAQENNRPKQRLGPYTAQEAQETALCAIYNLTKGNSGLGANAPTQKQLQQLAVRYAQPLALIENALLANGDEVANARARGQALDALAQVSLGLINYENQNELDAGNRLANAVLRSNATTLVSRQVYEQVALHVQALESSKEAFTRSKNYLSLPNWLHEDPRRVKSPTFREGDLGVYLEELTIFLQRQDDMRREAHAAWREEQGLPSDDAVLEALATPVAKSRVDDDLDEKESNL